MHYPNKSLVIFRTHRDSFFDKEGMDCTIAARNRKNESVRKESIERMSKFLSMVGISFYFSSAIHYYF